MSRRLCQIAKVVSCRSPIDTASATQQCANVNMAKYDHVSFIVSLGNLAADAIITMNYATGTLVAGTAMGFSYYESTAGAALVAVVDQATITTVGVGGYTPANAARDNFIFVVEVTAQEVRTVVDAAGAALTNTYVGMRIGTPGANAYLVSVVAICQVNRYEADPNFMPNPIAA